MYAQVCRLEAEVTRLRCELAYARSQPASPAPQAGSGGNGSGGDPNADPRLQSAAAEQELAALAPRVAVPRLDFAVDQFVCVGARAARLLPTYG